MTNKYLSNVGNLKKRYIGVWKICIYNWPKPRKLGFILCNPKASDQQAACRPNYPLKPKILLGLLIQIQSL